MVTVNGAASSGAVPDQLHVPAPWVTEPVLAVMVTASSTSEKVPVLPTAVNSGAVTEGLSAATVGATSVALTVNEVVVTEPSALVAVMVTVYGADSSGAVPDQPHVPAPWVTKPVLAVIVTAASTSEKVPLFPTPLNP